VLKIQFFFKFRIVLFLNILFILGFWNSCQCHQSVQSDPSFSLGQKNPSSAAITHSLESQLPVRKFFSIFVGNFFEPIWEEQLACRYISFKPLKEGTQKERKIEKLKKWQPAQDKIDQDIKNAVFAFLDFDKSPEKKQQLQGLIKELSSLNANVCEMKSWFAICLGDENDIKSHQEIDKKCVLKKLPFFYVLRLIFLVWKGFETSIAGKLHAINFFSQIRALELLSLASMWLEDFLEEGDEDRSVGRPDLREAAERELLVEQLVPALRGLGEQKAEVLPCRSRWGEHRFHR